MKIHWEFEESDSARIRDLFERMKEDTFVLHRIARNVNLDFSVDLGPSGIWYALISCLLTTQQRSGPTSKVNQLVQTRPFPLGLDLCRGAQELEAYAAEVARKAGIWRGPTIAKQLTKNYTWLEKEGGWGILVRLVEELRLRGGQPEERRVARELTKHLAGVGPKQSRNLLQMLGLTKHEIPLDSRVVKWLNEGGFPLPLVSGGLGNEKYYSFVMDRVQAMCEEAKVLPCVLDALIFAAADKDEWTEDNLVW